MIDLSLFDRCRLHNQDHPCPCDEAEEERKAQLLANYTTWRSESVEDELEAESEEA